MAGNSLEFDEQGDVFFCFLAAFYTLVLLPVTYFFWPTWDVRDSFEQGKRKCMCPPCLIKRHNMKAASPMKKIKRFLVLTNEESRRNWEQYGNPDGPSAAHFGIALPKWLIKKENFAIVIAVYALVFMLILPITVGTWWYNTMKFSSNRVLLDTARHFHFSFVHSPFMALPRVIKLLSNAYDFNPATNKDVVCRPSDNIELPPLIMQIPIFTIFKKAIVGSPSSVKARALIYAHLERLELPPKTLHLDRQYIVKNSLRLIDEMINTILVVLSPAMQENVSRQRMMQQLATLENCIRLAPMLVQALSDTSSPMLQLPHINASHLRHMAQVFGITVTTKPQIQLITTHAAMRVVTETLLSLYCRSNAYTLLKRLKAPKPNQSAIAKKDEIAEEGTGSVPESPPPSVRIDDELFALEIGNGDVDIEKRNVKTIRQLVRIPEEKRRALFRGLTDEQYRDVMNCCAAMPHLELLYRCEVEDEEDSSIWPCSTVTVRVTLRRSAVYEPTAPVMNVGAGAAAATTAAAANMPRALRTDGADGSAGGYDPNQHHHHSAGLYAAAEMQLDTSPMAYGDYVDDDNEQYGRKPKQNSAPIWDKGKRKKPVRKGKNKQRKQDSTKAVSPQQQQPPRTIRSDPAMDEPIVIDSASDDECDQEAPQSMTNENVPDNADQCLVTNDPDDMECRQRKQSVDQSTSPNGFEDAPIEGAETAETRTVEADPDGPSKEDRQIESSSSSGGGGGNSNWKPPPECGVKSDSRTHCTHLVHCPYFPVEKFEGWWVYLVDRKTRQLIAKPLYVATLQTEEQFTVKPIPDEVVRFLNKQKEAVHSSESDWAGSDSDGYVDDDDDDDFNEGGHQEDEDDEEVAKNTPSRQFADSDEEQSESGSDE